MLFPLKDEGGNRDGMEDLDDGISLEVASV